MRSNIKILDSVFENNIALDGGALALDCLLTMNCNFEISNTTFKDNKGLNSGGALTYNSYQPIISSDTSFSGNQAPYGPKYSSYPMKIVKIVEKDGEI